MLPQVERAFRRQVEEGVGALPVRAEVADSREVIGGLGDSGRDRGIQQGRSPGSGRTGKGGVTEHRRVPSRHHIPPTVIHLEEGSRVALAGPSWPSPEL